MPAAAVFIGVLAVETGVAAAIGTAIAGATVSAATATAIGSGVISAGLTVAQGGSVSDALKSAVVGGVASYVGSSIASSVTSGIRAEAIMNGDLSFSAADSLGKVAGSMAAGGIQSSVSAALSGKDPIEALIKGGLTAGLTSTAMQAVQKTTAEIPGFNDLGKDYGAAGSAAQRAVNAAIVSEVMGKDVDQAVLGSLLRSGSEYLSKELVDLSPALKDSYVKAKLAGTDYEENIKQQNQTIDEYKSVAAKINESYWQVKSNLDKYNENKDWYDNFDAKIAEGGWSPQFTEDGFVYMRQVDGRWQSNPGRDWYLQEANKYAKIVNDAAPAYNEAKAAAEAKLSSLSGRLDSLKSSFPNLEKNLFTEKENLDTSLKDYLKQEEVNADLIAGRYEKLSSAIKSFSDTLGRDPTQEEIDLFAKSSDPEKVSQEKASFIIKDQQEENQVIKKLQEYGLTPSPERIAAIKKEWDFDPETPNVGFGEAFSKSDKIDIANDRADTVQEAAALAKSLGFSDFNFGGNEYKINIEAPQSNPYDFFASFDDAYKAARADLGAGKSFDWTNPATGETKNYSTYTSAEQTVADQKRIDMMPAYGGVKVDISNAEASTPEEAAALAKARGANTFSYGGSDYRIGSATQSINTRTGRPADADFSLMPDYGGSQNTRTGRPAGVDNIYIDKLKGTVVEDTRVWNAAGDLVSGELKTVDPTGDSPAAQVAKNINDGIGKAMQAYIDVTSGVIKGGANLLNQVGVLGGMTGLVNMDNWMTRTASSINKQIDSIRSEEFRGNEKLLNDAIAKAGDAGAVAQAIETAKQFGANPLQTAEFIAKNGVSLLVGGGAMAAARALGAGMTVAEAAAIGANAVSQGADVAGEAYQDAIKNKKTAEEALNAARLAWAGSALTSAVANKFIPGALSNETAIAAQNVAKQSMVKALSGEMSSELAEEVSGKVISNLASGNAWDKDLGTTAVQALIGSGMVTGLVQVAQTGSLDTALAMAKDAGVSQDKIDSVRKEFESSIGSPGFNLEKAKADLSSLLDASNLGANSASQIQDLIAKDVTYSSLASQLVEAGTSPEFAQFIAGQSVDKILSSDSPQQAFNALSDILQQNGYDQSAAKSIANESLTGVNVPKQIEDSFKSAGYTPTQDELLNLISQNYLATPETIAGTVSQYADSNSVSRDEAIKALKDAGITAPSSSLVDSLVGQYDQTKLADKLSGISVLTNKDIEALSSDLSGAIADAKAAGLAGDAALQAGINKVAGDLGTTKEDLLARLGTTESALQQQISGVSADIQAKYDSLTSDQKALADQLRQQGVDLNTAIQTAQQQTQQQIGKISSDVQAKYDSLTADQKALADALRQQGVDINTAIETVRTQTQEQIGGLSADLQTKYSALTAEQKALADQLRQQGVDTASAIDQARTAISADVQAKYDALSADQKALADALRQQGVDLNTAIETAKTQTQEQITGLAADVQAKYDSLTAEQKALADSLRQQGVDTAAAIEQARTSISADVQAKYDSLNAGQKALADQLAQQGVDLRTAIDVAAQQTQQQVVDLGTTLNKRVDELVKTGMDQYTATQQAIAEVNQQNQQLQELVGTQAKPVTQQDITAVQNMLSGNQQVNLAYDVNGDRQITKADLDYLTQVVSGQQPSWTAPAGSPWAPTGLYGQIAASEAQRQADVKAAEAQRQADIQAQIAREKEAARLGAIRTTAGQAQTQIQSLISQLPQAYKAAQTTTTPIYGGAVTPFSLEAPLDVGFFSPSKEKQTSQPGQQATKIASGGYIDDLLDLLRG